MTRYYQMCIFIPSQPRGLRTQMNYRTGIKCDNILRKENWLDTGCYVDLLDDPVSTALLWDRQIQVSIHLTLFK